MRRVLPLLLLLSLGSTATAQVRASPPGPSQVPGQIAGPVAPASPRIEIFVLEPELVHLTSADVVGWSAEDRIRQEADSQCRTAAGGVTGAVRSLSYRLHTVTSSQIPDGVELTLAPGSRYFKRLVCEVRY